jgi:hypothetical protein
LVHGIYAVEMVKKSSLNAMGTTFLARVRVAYNGNSHFVFFIIFGDKNDKKQIEKMH